MIRDRDRLERSVAHRDVLDAVEAGIEAAHPRSVIRSSVALDGDALRIGNATYDLAGFESILVLGGGKAAGTVAAALEAVLGDRIDGGLVVTTEPADTERIEVVIGDHPVPSERGEAGAGRVLDLADAADDRTLVLAAITGGGSALLPAPVEGVTLADLQSVTDALLASGADIGEINAVRKHLSAIKGGGLARAAAPATVVGLLFSDVVGNDVGVIASGPAAPDDSTYADALAVLERYGIAPPESVRAHLAAGAAGDRPETLDPDDPVFDRVSNHVLADGTTAIEAARDLLDDRGYATVFLSSRVRGEAREAAKTAAAIAEEIAATGNPAEAPAAVLSGGETTVTVRGEGRGGPNQEFALSAALDLPDGAVLASVDTDGSDGGTDAAGGLVDATTAENPRAARDALDDNDSFGFLSARDALVYTGSTGTNVNDLRVLVVE